MSTKVLTAILLLSSFLFLVYGKGGGECDRDELDKYQNQPTMPLDVVCPDGYALYKAESCYHRFDDLFPTTPSGRKKRSNGPYDRLWIWECRAVSSLREENCNWHRNINELEVPIIFQCPPNQFMAGVESTFNDDNDFDRVWSVRCCGIENWCQKDCYLTDFVNDFGENMEQHCAGGDKNDEKIVFTGLFSNYENDDRQFKFQECKFSLCGLDKIKDECH